MLLRRILFSAIFRELPRAAATARIGIFIQKVAGVVGGVGVGRGSEADSLGP